jgi:hypothetical protein
LRIAQVIEQARAARLVLEEERPEVVSGVGFRESLEGGDD